MTIRNTVLPSRSGRSKAVRYLQRFCRGKSRQYFESEAARRNVTPAALTVLLIGRISNDRLIDAVLDDAGEIDAQQNNNGAQH